MAIRNAIISAGFAACAPAACIARRAPRRGRGVILTFHRVRPGRPRPATRRTARWRSPHEFLDLALDVCEAGGLRARLARRGAPAARRRRRRAFAALTFDDGYRDTLDEALPVLERLRAPFTVYCATGFIERTAVCGGSSSKRRSVAWRRSTSGRRASPRGRRRRNRPLSTGSTGFCARDPEPELLETIGDLARRAGVDGKRSRRAFHGLERVGQLSRHPLATIGAHGVTHRRLAHWSRGRGAERKWRLRRLARGAPWDRGAPLSPIRSATRPARARANSNLRAPSASRPRSPRARACCFPEHAGRLTELPRVSVNGRWQTPGARICSPARRSGCGIAAGGSRRRKVPGFPSGRKWRQTRRLQLRGRQRFRASLP